ncbi:MAG: SPOR domain-containing protein [Alphaproteobacteria bacterium]|nr:SPOR domain-containing protein [Alphaproteobacteria bacterium]
MAKDEELELLDLDDDAELPELPCGSPLESEVRPKRPWLLFGIALVVIALSAYIIIRVVAKGSDDSVEINLDVPPYVATNVEEGEGAHVPGNIDETSGAPVRVVEDREQVTFNPVEPPKPRPATTATTPKPATTATATTKPRATTTPAKPAASAVTSGYMVQFGSYSSREAALAGQKKLEAAHRELFMGRPFVVLAAVLPDNKTTYRLRVTGFSSSNDASGFCSNAKSDGLDCYVTK